MDNFFIQNEEAGKRLDQVLSLRFPEFSRTYFQYLIKENLVLVNGETIKKRHLLKEADEVEVEFVLTPETKLEPENIPLDILYEDEDVLLINKPVGLVVHPGAGNWSGTFANALIYHCKSLQSIEENLRPGIVHRLDKNTSGVLLAAKNLETQQKLVSQFAQRTVQKKYLALCLGTPQQQTINAPIARDKTDRKKMAVKQGGKEAITEIIPIANNEEFSLVEAKPHTGRTHQIRVHLQSISHPILGDEVYGNLKVNKRLKLEHHLLHARSLSFTHPIKGERITITAPIPKIFKRFFTNEITHSES